jgi:hypothetical protein
MTTKKKFNDTNKYDLRDNELIQTGKYDASNNGSVSNHR